MLSTKVRYAHVFKDLHIASLISLGKLCDDGCTAIIDKNLLILSNELIYFYQEIETKWIYYETSLELTHYHHFKLFNRYNWQMQLFQKKSKNDLFGIFPLAVLVQL